MQLVWSTAPTNWVDYYMSPQRNCYCYNDVLQKHKSNGLVAEWWHQLLQDCQWNLTKRHISTISVYNMSRLSQIKYNEVNSCNNRKWFYIKKRQEADDIQQKQWHADYVDDLAHHTNTPAQAESLLHSLEQAAGGISLYVNTYKKDFMSIKQEGAIWTLGGIPLKLVDQFTFLSSNITSTETNVSVYIVRTWTAIGRLLIIWKSDL